MSVLLQPNLPEGITPKKTTLGMKVRGQKEVFIWISVHNATLARKIRKLLLSPSERDMVHIVETILLENISIIGK